MTQAEQRELVTMQVVKKIKKLGYHVYGPIMTRSYPKCWAFIRSKDGLHVGKFEVNEYADGVTFATVNKPNKVCGCGCRIQLHDTSIRPEEITAKHIEESFAIAPSWAQGKTRAFAEKYKWESFAEWLKAENKYDTNIQRY